MTGQNGDKDKIDFLGEHLKYELEMLDYSCFRMMVLPESKEYNEAYECFAVHARVCINFLTNHPEQDTFKANDFVDSSAYKLHADDDISAIKKRINKQVFHFTDERTRERDKKVGTDEMVVLFRWIRTHFPLFEGAMKTEYRTHWKTRSSELLRDNLPAPELPKRTTTQVVHVGEFFTPLRGDTAQAVQRNLDEINKR